MISATKRVYLHLYHGRTDPEQQMNDWGSNGPTFAVDWVSVTYLTEIRFGYTDEEGQDAEGDLAFVDDLVYYNGVYYGDWSVNPTREGRKLSVYNPDVARHAKAKMRYALTGRSDDPAGK